MAIDILKHINKFNEMYASDEQQVASVKPKPGWQHAPWQDYPQDDDIPSVQKVARYNTRQYLTGGRVQMKPGGLVEPGVTHYAKTSPPGKHFYYKESTNEWIVYKRPPGSDKKQVYAFKKKSDALKFLEKGKEERIKGFKKYEALRTQEVNKAYDNINKWTKTWLKKNVNNYAAKEISNFEKDFARSWAAELKKNPSLYKPHKITELEFHPSTKTGLPWARELEISELISPRDKTSDSFFKKFFYKEKLKNSTFNKQVKAYLEWVVASKTLKTTKEKYKGLKTPGKAAGAARHLEIAKINKFDPNVIHLISEIQKGDPARIYSSLKEHFPELLKKYTRKVSLGASGWRENLRVVAKNAGLDDTLLLRQMKNENVKVAKMLGIDVNKLPIELRYTMDHVAGLAEAANYTGPNKAAFSRKTLNTFMARTVEQNKILGRETLSLPRTKLIKKFNDAKTLDAKAKIVGELNELVEKRIPGELEYKVTKSGNLDFKALAPQKTLKTRIAAYKNIPEVKKTFNSFQNGIFEQAKKAGIGGSCKKFDVGGSYAKCMQNAIDNEVKLAKSGGKGSAQAVNKLKGVGKWAGKWFGLIDVPLEFAFALPSLVRGDIEGAKQSTTFGLFGWGKTELEQMQERNPEAYKYMKHYDDTMNHFQLQWQKNDLEKRLEGFKTTGTYGQDVKDRMTGQLQSINEQLQSIQDNYIGYETPDAMHSGYEALQKDIGVEGARRQKDAWSVVKREDVDLPDTVAGHFMKQNLERSRGRWQTDPIIERLGLEKDFILPDKPGLSPVELAGRYGRKNLMDYYGSHDVNRGNIDPGVPFSKGGSVDKGKRAFMKLLAALGIGTATIGTGLLKIVKGSKGVTTIKAGDHIIQGTKGMPDWFIPLINRVTSEGKNVTGKLGTVEREIVHTKKISKGEEVTVYQDMNTGNVRIEYGPAHPRASNDLSTVHLEYRAGEVIEEGKYAGKKTKPEFEAVESEPKYVATGPDDAEVVWDLDNVVGNVDDLTTDTSKLKQFATKKKLTHKDKVKAKKKQEYRQKLEEDTSTQVDYSASKYGEGDYDDYLPDIDDLD